MVDLRGLPLATEVALRPHIGEGIKIRLESNQIGYTLNVYFHTLWTHFIMIYVDKIAGIRRSRAITGITVR